MNGFTTDTAEIILSSRFDRTKASTKYIAGFRTSKGRELALERARKNIVALWVECIDAQLHHNLEYRYYEPTKSRNSNLNANTKKLAQGKEAWYVAFTDSASLEEFLNWYQYQ